MKTAFTKTEDIVSRLRGLIDEGFKSGDVKLPTEQALSKMWGVSRGTIRKAMEDFVTTGILHKVAGAGTFIDIEVLKKAGVAKKKIKTVVLVYDILEISDFRYRIIRGVVKAANARGYDTAIASFENAMEIFSDKFQASDKKENTAMISCHFKYSHISKIKEFPTKIPYVALNDYNYKGVAEYAVLGVPWMDCGLRYLSSIGHKKILLLHESLTRSHIEEIGNIVKDIKKKNGFDIDLTIKECLYDYNRVISELNEFFGQKNDRRPTAILCIDDKVAAWTVSHLKKIGLNVPEDVSVLGTGDFDIGESMYPRITTTALDYDLMGELAMDMIEKQFDGKKVNKKLIYVNNKLIERESCRKT
jgi:GntR family transcriptional regulator, arabinose operon transcriptional repressor